MLISNREPTCDTYQGKNNKSEKESAPHVIPNHIEHGSHIHFPTHTKQDHPARDIDLNTLCFQPLLFASSMYNLSNRNLLLKMQNSRNKTTKVKQYWDANVACERICFFFSFLFYGGLIITWCTPKDRDKSVQHKAYRKLD